MHGNEMWFNMTWLALYIKLTHLFLTLRNNYCLIFHQNYTQLWLILSLMH